MCFVEKQAIGFCAHIKSPHNHDDFEGLESYDLLAAAIGYRPIPV
jgi:hypothetical protein